MSNNAYGSVILLATTIVFAVGVYALVRNSLSALLNETLRLQAGTTFFLRSLLIVLLTSALAQAIEGRFSLAGDAKFMEYVWAFAAEFSDVLQAISIVWLVYLLLVTVIAVQRHGG